MPSSRQKPFRPPTWMRFSLRGILIVTAIMALSATGVAHLVGAANHGVDEIGSFILVTNVAPLGLAVALYWIFRLMGWMKG